METDTATRFIGLWGGLAIRAWDMVGQWDSAMEVSGALAALAAVDAAHAAASIHAVAPAGGAIMIMIMITIETIVHPPTETILQSGSTESLQAI